ncbi:hypothetical protein TW81_12225 [Vibrio galatheae]|uniref:Uncharacterized protein n=1 Tax=Vibrio galatheae TaxID=579748 RepID=A0A0F4NIL6_9VIBR|nr:NirD/YgiW/YdeI family stress tolerance protein [Vibrio galatheae]KJY82960.1 hypothetical protein TW81_12225 [Vibrio galatheae]
MKKLLVSLCVVASLNATAAFEGPGSVPKVMTVSSILKMKDDQWVAVEGFITRQLREEHYMFRDNTGEIEVEIDHEIFNGLKITPERKIKISGELDKDWASVSIDVNHIELN